MIITKFYKRNKDMDRRLETAAETVQAALARFIAATAAQRPKHASIEASLLVLAFLDMIKIGHLLSIWSAIHFSCFSN